MGCRRVETIVGAIGSPPEKKICKGFPPSLSFGEGSHPKQNESGRVSGERKNLELVGGGGRWILIGEGGWAVHAAEMPIPASRSRRGHELRLSSKFFLQGYPPEKEYAGEGSHPTQNKSARGGGGVDVDVERG